VSGSEAEEGKKRGVALRKEKGKPLGYLVVVEKTVFGVKGRKKKKKKKKKTKKKKQETLLERHLGRGV